MKRSYERTPEFRERESHRRGRKAILAFPYRRTRLGAGKRRGKSTREHIVVAERALGKHLPEGAVVHHVNGKKTDNRNKNLVICQDSAYHNLLHKRQRIVDAGGHPDTEKLCGKCGLLKSLDDFYWYDATHTKKQSRCRSCYAEDHRFKKAHHGTTLEEAA